MDNKSPECFACEPRARGVRVDLSPQKSIVLPHEHFVCAEYSAEQSVEILKLKFMAHEVTLAGYQLRRIENAILNRELSWLCALPEKFRVQTSDRPFVANLTVRNLESADGNEKK